MARRPRPLVSVLTAGARSRSLRPGSSRGGAAQAAKPPTKPTKVVIILVDALSKEIVDEYDMDNVQALMSDYVDTPKGYLGHTGSVTVVTHNVLTSGPAPQAHGLDQRGLPRRRARAAQRHPPTPRARTSARSSTSPATSAGARSSRCRHHDGYPKLADYLNDTGSVYTVSPKAYAAYGFGGVGSTSTVTFGSVTCPVPETGPVPGRIYGSLRGPTGVDVPSYITGECGTRYYVERNKTYDTYKEPASLYFAQDDRYLVGDEPGHEGGDLWATDATLDIMENDPGWTGLFVSLPGVDKAAHMWGGVDDPEAEGARRRPEDAHGVRHGDRRRPGRPDHGRARGERRPRQHHRRADGGPRLGGRPGTSTARTTRSSTTASSTGTTATSRTTSPTTTGPSRPSSRWSTPTTSGCPTATPR